MAKRRSPVKLTGGGGFAFEDAVAAYFAVHMLSSSMYLDAEFGPVTAINFQARDLGWLLDDLVVTFSGSDGPRQLALSVKSDKQVKQTGFPSDFARAVWEQWLETESAVFKQDHDLLGLAVGELAQGVKSAWDQMCKAASEAPPDRVVQRLTAHGQSSKIKRALFASLQCPDDLKGRGTTDEIVVASLLAHVRLIHFDFQSVPSGNLCQAMELCRSIVKSGDTTDAEKLWNRLIGIAAEQRPVGGMLDLSKLIGKLRSDFQLNPYPNHRSDWERLEQATNAAKERIRDQVADGVRLDRTQLRQNVIEQLRETPAVVLIGESGCGKSALAKRIAHGGEFVEHVVWLSADILNAPDLACVRQILGLNNDLVALLDGATTKQGFLILDGIDRFSKQALACTADLLRSLPLSPDSGTCPWRILLTSEPAGWEQVRRQLIAQDVNLKIFITESVGFPSPVEVRGLLSRIPALNPVAHRPELSSLLQNLKILDWVAASAETRKNIGTKSWVGLSEVMDWVWEYWIGTDSDRHARASVLKKLCQIEGASLVATMPLSELDQAQLLTLGTPELNHLVRVDEERIRFTHDLVGDWARVRVLIEEQDITRALTVRAVLPRWHRAIRLYGQRLLEQEQDSTAVWRRTIDQCVGDDNATAIARDLLLESVIFAVNADVLLERVWSDLAEQGGLLLQRLLKLFLHSATFPDPRAAGIAETEADVGLLASMMRVPYGPYWPSVLSMLYRHIDEVVKLPGVVDVAAQVCQLWLRTTPMEIQQGQPCPGRQEAAVVAVKLAREVQGLKAEQVIIPDRLDQHVYEAMLYAAPNLPDDVSELSLELVRRRDPAAEILACAEEHERREQARLRKAESDPEYVERVSKLGLIGGIGPSPRGPLREPWPDGPRERVDHGFQKVCLNNAAAFQSLIMTRPAVAREVLLAACIEPPQHEDYNRDYLRLDDDLGTESWHEGYPSLYFRGPFLPFLLLSPEEGLQFTLRLVNFATERWVDSIRRDHRRYGDEHGEPVLAVNVTLEQGCSEWLGNDYVYRWHRLSAIGAACVANSLMALERWLYEQIDAGHDITNWINTILQGSRSVAFAGILSAVGRKEPDLLETSLRPLLGIWQVYRWELQRLVNANVWCFEETTWWQQGGDRFLKLAREWHTLPHRGVHLQDVAVRMLLTRPDVAQYFELVRKSWESELKHVEDRASLELLIARFDPANYSRIRQADGQEYFALEWPTHLREATESAAKEGEERLALMNFPIRCRALLDKRDPLDEEELKAFWTTLQSLVERAKNPEDEELSRHLADSVCGGVAVLVILHRDWLRSDTKREKWCRDNLYAVLAGPPPELEFTASESIYPYGWGRFAAECLVTYLSETPDDTSLREFVAVCIANSCYESTAYAMCTAFRVRDRLGREFISLQNLVILWAGLSCVIRSAQRCESDITRWERWRERLIEAFRDSRISTEPLQWERVARIAGTTIYRIEKQRFPGIDDVDDKPDDGSKPLVAAGLRRRKGRRSRHPGLDVQLIQAAFNWIPTLDKARNQSERRAWVALLHETLGVTLAMLPHVSDTNDEFKRTPYEYDRWIFERVAVAIPHMTRDEGPEKLWQPILDLGGPGHYWVSSFLGAWLIHGTRMSPSPEIFVDRWREMIEYVLVSPQWTQQNSRLHFCLADLMMELMGLDWQGRSIGEPEYADAIKQLRPQFETFSQRWLSVPNVAAHFASFLARPAAKVMLCDGVQWLYAAISNYDHYDWRDDDLEENLVEALRTCWIKEVAEVQNNPIVQEAFLNLLGILIRRQNRAAFELRDEVTRSMGN